uniref:Uncharacterized protein n=1 Tax=Ananas comosus var. bracteatus TaxID=296719 RepID=A0A6V7P2M6_ANACO|nr:unnamed protein product [Ananas comosus var. bracteatus]
MTRTRVDSRPATCQPMSTLRVSSSNWNGMKRKAKRENVPLGVAEGDRKDETCPVCLEHPHNAVLLLCSSYDKGCRPFMCGTGRRHSNCFEQFTKVRTKATGDELEGATELACPLCRSQLKGWTVVEPVRQYLNRKKRSCMQDGCSFSGTFKAMCKHVRSEHPKAKPRAVDPVLEQKWKQLEDEREQQDVISTISSLMPGAVVLGITWSMEGTIEDMGMGHTASIGGDWLTSGRRSDRCIWGIGRHLGRRQQGCVWGWCRLGTPERARDSYRS